METNIESHLIEKRVFKPAKDFSKKARIKSVESALREMVRRRATQSFGKLPRSSS